jgi:uncharacterized protein (TIGR00288 family)
LSPWWLRPTSEGAANEEKDEKEDQREQIPAAPATHEGDAASRPMPEGAAGTPRADNAQRADHADRAGAAAAAAPGAGPAAWGEPAAAPQRPDTSYPAHQPSPPAQPAPSAYPEPYRAFWQPREETPAREAAAPPVQPAAGVAASPAVSWRSQQGADAGRSSEPTPAISGSSGSSGFSRSAAGAAGEMVSAEAAEPAESSGYPLQPLQTSDVEADGEGEGEVEERDGENRPEVRKKRSRRSRGGRRKNGRAAASAPGSELADEDDDDLDDEAPAQFPAAPPSSGPQPLAPRATRSGESYVISGSDLDSMSREIIISVPDRQRPQHEERKIAVFCDFENIALGVRDSEISKFDIGLILERLLEKGKIIVKKAYADWERYSDYKRPFHEAAIELIDIPQKFYSGKNSADIKMVVDAMDLSYAKEHLDTFVILSGDSDFSPLVSKLKENNKYVIGIGVKNSSSNLLVDNCDEFIYYEDIWRDAQKGPKLDGLSKKTAEAFSLMVESIQALVRENKDVLWGSMIKQTMQRKKPSFNEGYYGYSTFSELLEDAERKNIVKLKKDQRSGTYIVTGFAKSGDAGPGRRQA